jgi:hypothetical protein
MLTMRSRYALAAGETPAVPVKDGFPFSEKLSNIKRTYA